MFLLHLDFAGIGNNGWCLNLFSVVAENVVNFICEIGFVAQ
jgi:hypothetical protein